MTETYTGISHNILLLKELRVLGPPKELHITHARASGRLSTGAKPPPPPRIPMEYNAKHGYKSASGSHPWTIAKEADVPTRH
jgi:hypothetical protein